MPQDEQILTLTDMLTQMERGRFSTEGERLALSEAIRELAEYREMLEAAVEIQFQDELFIDRGPKGWRGFIGNVRLGGISTTDFFDSALDVWREGVRGEGNAV